MRRRSNERSRSPAVGGTGCKDEGPSAARAQGQQQLATVAIAAIAASFKAQSTVAQMAMQTTNATTNSWMARALANLGGPPQLADTTGSSIDDEVACLLLLH